MNYKYLIVYKKKSGQVIYRYVTTIPKYKVGDKTSMGWQVLDIKNMYKGKFYSPISYSNEIKKRNIFVKISDKLNELQHNYTFNNIFNLLSIYTFLKICVKLNIL